MLSLLPLESIVSATQLFTSSIVLMTTLALLLFLIQKDISSSLRSPRARRLAQTLDVVLVPLVVIFVINAFFMIAAAIR